MADGDVRTHTLMWAEDMPAFAFTVAPTLTDPDGTVWELESQAPLRILLSGVAGGVVSTYRRKSSD
jgi:hypothetical protein